MFFKSRDPDALRTWCRERMGVEVQPWGGAQFLCNRRDRPGVGYTAWNPFRDDTTCFAPSERPFMINLRVDDLEGMLTRLRAAGAQVLDRREDRRAGGENGKFGYVMDPDGDLLELWEQNDDHPYVPKA